MYGDFFKIDKNGLPAWNADITKAYADFDPSKITEQFMGAMKGASAPGFDMEAILDIQRKNLEALTKASQAALHGVQEVAHKQAEVFQQSFAQATAAAEALGGAGTPEELAKKQADLYKTAFETALANAQKVTDVVTKANEATIEVINARVAEALKEVNGQAKPAKPVKK